MKNQAKLVIAAASMVSSLSSVILALCLLLLVKADGRTTHTNIDDVNVVSSNTSLLDSTSSSTTNYNDVRGLTTLINQFPQLTNFTRDPCYPHKLPWIACSNDPIRRVTALYLGVESMYGYLPDFSSMDALQTIDLPRNSLFGLIPGFLGTFPELTYLNLANNHFSGLIPDSLANNKKIKLIVAGNSRMCSSSNSCSPLSYTWVPRPPTPRSVESQFPTDVGLDKIHKIKKISKLPKILGGIIPPSFLAAIGGTVCCICRRRRRKTAADIAAAAMVVREEKSPTIDQSS